MHFNMQCTVTATIKSSCQNTSAKKKKQSYCLVFLLLFFFKLQQFIYQPKYRLSCTIWFTSMYIFLTLYTKHFNIKSSQNLQKERKKKTHRLQVHRLLHQQFYTGHAYNVSIQRCIILILHSIFKLKLKKKEGG